MYHVLLPVDHDEDRLDDQLETLLDFPGRDELAVTALHVHEDIDAPADEAGKYVIETLNEDIADLQGIPDTVERAVEALREAGVFEGVRTEVGDAVSSILDVADDVDAIFLGMKDRSPVGEAVFGSVTQGVIVDGDRPVLVAK